MSQADALTLVDACALLRWVLVDHRLTRPSASLQFTARASLALSNVTVAAALNWLGWAHTHTLLTQIPPLGPRPSIAQQP